MSVMAEKILITEQIPEQSETLNSHIMVVDDIPPT
jgi:hypothetical protein